MGRYDIKSEFRGSTELTLTGLCKEISQELKERVEKDNSVKDEGSYYDFDILRNKLKNSDKSGIIDKLKSKLGLDIETAAGESDRERFDMLKIVKCLYYIEKDGWPKSKKGAYCNTIRKVAITDILAKPSLENIPTIYSDKSEYGDVFQELFDAVKQIVPDADSIYGQIEGMDAYWDYITYKMFDYVSTDKAIKNQKEAGEELDRIGVYVSKRIREKLEGCPPDEIPFRNGVATTFFTMLACHRILCNESDRIKINYKVVDEEDPSKGYVEKMLEWDDRVLKWEVLDAIADGNVDDDSVALFEGLVSYNKGIAGEDVKHYRYALTHARVVARWVEKEKGVDFSEGIWFTLYVAIIQEMMQIKKNGDKVENQFYGYKYRYRSFMSAVKKPDSADAIIVQAWIRRLENRIAFNVGASELLRKKREIETDIFEIKKILFSYKNYEDIISANELISRFVGRNMMSTGLAMEVYNRMSNGLLEGLRNHPEVKDVKVLAHGGEWDSINLFKEIQLDTSGAEKRVVREISGLVDELLTRKKKNPENYTSMWRCPIHFDVQYGGERKYSQMLICTIDVGNGFWNELEVTINAFVSVMPDDEAAHLSSIGLEKFVKK